MKEKQILILGASGHSKMIIDIIHKNKSHNIVGLIDSFKTKGQGVLGYDIIGNVDDIPALQEKYNIEGIIVGVGDNFTRYKLKNSISKISPEIKFISAIHPSAIIAEDVFIADGTIIMAGSAVNVGSKIGHSCILNTNSSLGHDSIMEDFSSLGPGSSIGGNVKIGLCSAICLKAGLNNNITIGSHTVIGAGSLVVNNISDHNLAYGVPAKVQSTRNINDKYL